MIVQCPSCASRYRIRDANIPPTGGKIRCPSCSHSFIVYPEANEDDGGDKTSITSQGEMSNLVNKMDHSQRPAPADEDYVATQVATGAELDKQRAMEALKNELGDPVDMDGTVEIQNPMHVWKQAQDALKASQNAAAEATDEEDYDEAKTQVVDPATVSQSMEASKGLTAGNLDDDATFQLDREAVDQLDPARDSSHGVDPAGNGSGMHPYAQNTPPGGRSQEAVSDSSGAFGSAEGSGPQTVAAKPTGPPAPPPVPGAGGGPGAGAHGSNAGPPGPGGGSGPGGRGLNATAGPGPSAERPGSGASRPGPQPGPGDSGLTAADLFDDAGADEDLPPTLAAAEPGPGSDGGQGASGAAADPNHDGPWKLKTNFGLTYEFPDTRGLRSWLSGREELSGYEVSHDDGETFHPLNDYPQLRKDSRGPMMQSGNISMPSRGSGQFPTASASGQFPEESGSGPHRARDPSGPVQQQPPPASAGGQRPAGMGTRHPNASSTMRGPKVNTDFEVPSRDTKYHGLLWVVFVLLLLVAVAIAVQTFGVFDIKGEVLKLMGQMPQVEQTQPPPSDQPTPVAEEETAEDDLAIKKKQEEEVQKLLDDAGRLVEGNKLQSALDKLETTVTIAPDNPRVYEMMSDVHERLGQADESAEAAAKAKELREAAGIADSPDMGSADASEPEASSK